MNPTKNMTAFDDTVWIPPPEPTHFEECLSVHGCQWIVNATFRGADSFEVEDRLIEARRIVNRFENDLDAHITQKRSELSAALCLLCDELDIE